MGGLMIVVAVALGTLAPVKGVALAGGVEVKTVTLLVITAKFTCCAVVALGTAKSGRGPGCWALSGVGPPRMATPPVVLGAGLRVGLGTVGILSGCFDVVAKSTG